MGRRNDEAKTMSATMLSQILGEAAYEELCKTAFVADDEQKNAIARDIFNEHGIDLLPARISSAQALLEEFQAVDEQRYMSKPRKK